MIKKMKTAVYKHNEGAKDHHKKKLQMTQIPVSIRERHNTTDGQQIIIQIRKHHHTTDNTLRATLGV